MRVCELTVPTYLEGRRECVYEACALDPSVVGQHILPKRIRAACDELFAAHAALLPAELR